MPDASADLSRLLEPAAAPTLLCQQTLRCAARQYAEGEVQHGWHAPQGAGLRTLFSDGQAAWLAHALSHHLCSSGDEAGLDERQPFIEGPPIPNGAEDLHGMPRVGVEAASLYEHAVRTLDRRLHVGQHGPPWMGCGAWNDAAAGWRAALEGPGRAQRGATVPFSSDSTISTRRFIWRPPELSLPATGCDSP